MWGANSNPDPNPDPDPLFSSGVVIDVSGLRDIEVVDSGANPALVRVGAGISFFLSFFVSFLFFSFVLPFLFLFPSFSFLVSFLLLLLPCPSPFPPLFVSVSF